MSLERLGFLFTALLFAVAGWAVFSAVSWRQEVAMFPLFVGTTALVLTGAELIRTTLSMLRCSSAQVHQSAEDQETETASRAWMAPVWFFGSIVAVLLLGIPVGFPLMLLLLVRYGFGEGWLLSILTVVVLEAIALFIFGWLFGVVWPSPLLLDWFF
ncbi:MAG: tripartite tricarboxylate transporter TctB family protein [Candidatus Binatia bacterium]